MPLYQYRDKRTGKVLELSRPVDGRDDVPGHLERILAPGAAVLSGAPPETGASYKVPRALKQIEGGRTGARDIARHFGMSVDAIKRVWRMACLMGCLGILGGMTLAQDLSPGLVFQDGQRLTAAQLGQLVSQATILPTFYTGKAVDTALSSTDLLLVYAPGAGAYYQVSLANLVLNNTNLIAGKSVASQVKTNDALLLLSGSTLYQVSPVVLLTNSVAVEGLLTNALLKQVDSAGLVTNWPTVSVLSNSDTFAFYSVATNAGHGNTGIVATATISTLANQVQSNLTWKPQVFGFTNSSTLDNAFANAMQGIFSSKLSGVPQLVRFTALCVSTDFVLAGTELDVSGILMTNAAVSYTNSWTQAFTTYTTASSLFTEPVNGSTVMPAMMAYDGTGTRQILTASKWKLACHAVYFPP